MGWKNSEGVRLNKGRLEAFTDAIVITILILELPKPQTYTLVG